MKQSMMGLIAATSIGIFVVAAAPALADAKVDAAAVDTSQSSSNIVQIAESDPDLSTLVKAVAAAGLVSTLESPGAFTVFAPTNEAFAKIPAGILDYLLANPAVLKQVLLYHVVLGAHTLDITPPKTAEGENLFVSLRYNTSGVGIQVNNSWVSVKPIQASNGVIYIIDSVLLPQFR